MAGTVWDTFCVLCLICIPICQGRPCHHPQLAYQGTAAVEDMVEVTTGGSKGTKPASSYLSAFFFLPGRAGPLLFSKQSVGTLCFYSLLQWGKSTCVFQHIKGE